MTYTKLSITFACVIDNIAKKCRNSYMTATIYDIAKSCDISHVTVSRALRNHPRVKKETRKRILNAARELGYRPSHSARSLRHGKTQTVCVVLPDLTNPFFSEFARAVEEGVVAWGYGAAITEYAGDADRERTCLEHVLEGRYDGVIAFVSRFEPLKELLNEAWDRRIPCVVPGLPPDVENGRLDGTAVDIHVGIEQAVDHLVELGHREIVFVADWPVQSGAGLDRLAAMRSAFARHGLAYDETSVIVHAIGPELEEGYRAARHLMQREPATTAIICVNDYLAVGVIKGLTELGLRIPQDISLVGADNSWIARYWPVGLTSIDLKTQEHAAAVLEILFDRLGGDEWKEPRRIRLETNLVIRESSGRVRHGTLI